MRHVTALAVASALLLLSRPALAGDFLLIVPPARVDVSPVTMSTGERTAPGLHVLAGLHWASMTPNPRTRFDLGAGYLYERYAAPPADRPGVLFADPGGASDPRTEIHGAYLELSGRSFGDKHQRGWLGARGELLFASDGRRTYMGLGVTARASWEAVATIKGGGSNGAAIGAFGIGGYVEAGYRYLPDGQNAVQATAGLSVRLPFIIVGG